MSTVRELLFDVGMKFDQADAKKADRAAEQLKEKFRGVIDVAKRVGVALGTAFVGIGVGAIKTAGTFESLRASLKTVTGSAEAADKAFKQIKDFTSTTPFDLEQVAGAFIKLKALGLDPSEEALRSYGNTASAMGKSLNDFIEAVADASTGEFERLKEFGIKASSQGDEVAFTFQGVTTTVGKNADEITSFLQKIGNENFAGAMSEQMDTLKGVISNLKDNVAQFLVTVANMGPLEEMKKLLGEIRDAAGGSQGLAKTLAQALVRAIRAVRRNFDNIIKVMELTVETMAFLVENFDKLIALFAASKVSSAFRTIDLGFKAMGIAATGALGPIGLVATALTALIPIAIDAGNAIGDALAASPGQITTGKRGAPKVGTRGTAKASQEVVRLQRKLDAADQRGASRAERAAIGGELSQAKSRLADEMKRARSRRAKAQAAEAEEAEVLGGIQSEGDAAAAAILAEEEKKRARRKSRRGGRRRKKKSDTADSEGKTFADLIGLDESANKLSAFNAKAENPVLGTTINQVTINAPNNTQISVRQRNGESTDGFTDRIVAKIEEVVGRQNRLVFEKYKGATA